MVVAVRLALWVLPSRLILQAARRLAVQPRNAPAPDVGLGKLIWAVEAISRAAHDLRDRLASLEANPLLVASRGVVAVDALAEARPVAPAS